MSGYSAAVRSTEKTGPPGGGRHALAQGHVVKSYARQADPRPLSGGAPGREVVPMELLTELVKLVTAIVVLFAAIEKRKDHPRTEDDASEKDEDR